MTNTVLLAAPLIVFALVLLLGFTGCGLNTRGLPGDGTTGQTGSDSDKPYADEVKDSNPIAYWRLSDAVGSSQAKDEIGAPPPEGDHPGTYQDSWTLGVKPGLNDSDPDATPARFDGTGSVEVPHAPEFEMQEFTVEALVQPDSVAAPGVIVSNMATPATAGWALRIAPPVKPGNDGYFVPSVSDGTDSGSVEAGFNLGTVFHVAMTFDGMVLILYVDGAVHAAVSSMPYAPNTQEPLRIGLGLQGAIQEVAVYDYALTAEQITAHYLANTSPET